MALQIVLLFGHLHLPHLTEQLLHLDTAPAAVETAAVVATAGKRSDQLPPADGPDDDCPICLAMHMVASGALPAAPVIDQPVEFTRLAHVATIGFDVVARRSASFQTRAPPRA